MDDFVHHLRCWSYYRQYLGQRAESAETLLKNLIGIYSAHPSAPLTLFPRLQSFSENSF